MIIKQEVMAEKQSAELYPGTKDETTKIVNKFGKKSSEMISVNNLTHVTQKNELICRLLQLYHYLLATQRGRTHSQYIYNSPRSESWMGSNS